MATVNRRWGGRETSVATVTEDAPLATSSEVTRIAGGLAHLAAGAANLVGADRAAGAIGSLAEGANSAADAIDEANFGLSVLDPRDSEVLGALVINGPGAAVGSLVGLTRGARALGAVDDMARWGDDAGRLSLAGDAQGALSRTGGLDGGLGLVDDGAKVAPKLHKHHTVPREVLKKHLPTDVANYPLVRGRAGAPNRWKIPIDLHKGIHKGAGGGAYNEVFKQRLRDLGGKPTAHDVLRIRDDLVKQFGLGGYRP